VPIRDAVFLGTCLLASSLASSATDSVTVQFSSGYPLPNRSSDAVTLVVARTPPPSRTIDIDADRYFDAVRKVLQACGVTRDWQHHPPDAPFVRIDIDLEGRKLRLITDAYRLRPEPERANAPPPCPRPGQGENDRNRAALEAILEATLEMARTRAGR
jgi:hypothetical protein